MIEVLFPWAPEQFASGSRRPFSLRDFQHEVRSGAPTAPHSSLVRCNVKSAVCSANKGIHSLVWVLNLST